MKNIIFLAPPATGKGTLSKYLTDTYDYIHISTGDLLRKVAMQDTEIGKTVKDLMKKGEYIKDDIVLPLFKECIENIGNKPYILDGIPRTLNQAQYLDNNNVNNYVVINLDIDEDVLKKRSTGRRVCSNCKTSYNINSIEFKPKKENICDICNGTLIQREDDNEETFNNRLEVYKKETKPLIEYYQSKNKLVKINANQNTEDIIKDLIKVIGDNND